MGLNDQAKALNNRSGRKTIFREGIRSKNISGKDQHAFRILPAFHPQVADPGTSWQPCIDQNGNLTDWAAMVQVIKFVGHGKSGIGSRVDLLSLKTFATDREDRWCPLVHLHQFIQQDPVSWGYLTKDVGEGENKIRAAFSRPSSILVANILDMGQSTLGSVLGVFSQSAATSLLDRKAGLVYQPNAMPGIEKYIATNYLCQYANGDITDPNEGPILVCYRLNDKGDFSAYKVIVYVDGQGRVVRRPLDQQQMASRVNLTKYTDYLAIPTEEELVQQLVQQLNGRSPMGYHEHALLKLAFPQFKIPDPPSAPGAIPTVAAGFAPSAGAAGIPGMAPQIPGAAPTLGYTPPAAPVGIPGAAPAMGIPPAPAMPAAVAPQIPGAAPVMGIPPAPAMPPAAAAPVTAAPTAVPPEVRAATANMAAATPTVPATATAPVVPGDPVAAGFNEQDFLARIRSVGAPK